MAQGVSIHIGLNHVDPSAYDGWDGQLKGCINDAMDMKAIADGLGYNSQTLTDEEATVANVVQAISSAASQLESGDILFLTYSGHGAQVPDMNAEPESDGQDETWVLYDKELIDDQLYTLWSQFEAGVRIIVLSDSCHSGTALRMHVMRHLEKAGAGASLYGGSGSIREKFIPRDRQNAHYNANREYYTTAQYLSGRAGKTEVQASVLLISGCQDSQTSSDGDQNGLFTQTLLNVWQDGSFRGSYKQLHRAICDAMPPTQTPNYYKVGVPNADFEAQIPFTIQAEEPVNDSVANPTVSGPASVSREDYGAPTFVVYTAGAPYYIFEITSDPALFRTDQGRDTGNFYGSYDDPNVMSRLTAASFTLPDEAWDALKDSARLYFRIGTTTSATGWDNYTTSTPDASAELAPSMEITDGRAISRPPHRDKPGRAAARPAQLSGPRIRKQRSSRLALR